MVTHRPPHSSVRALLRHTALTSGRNARAKALFRVGVYQPAWRDVPVNQAGVAGPGHPMTLTPTLQRVPPSATNFTAKVLESVEVAGHRVIVEITLDHG
jgi:hypothetical protein